MNDNIVSPPSLDLPYYAHSIGQFFSGNYPGFWEGLKAFIGVITGLSIVLSVILLVAIVATVEALKALRKKEEEMYMKKIEPAYTEREAGDEEWSKRWRQVMDHMSTDNPNDWRSAIIEADIMLEDLLIKLGYRGEGIGVMLSRVKTGDFKTLEQAGEAHGVRNRIAHDGSNYVMNKVEAQRTIGLYRQVFEEFYHIS